jgi:hypothetical protein
VVENYAPLTALRRAPEGRELAWYAADDPAPGGAMWALWCRHALGRIAGRLRPRPALAPVGPSRPAHQSDGLPGRAGDLPNRVNDLPHRAGDLPKHAEGLPDRTDDLPNHSRDLPDRAGDRPDLPAGRAAGFRDEEKASSR